MVCRYLPSQAIGVFVQTSHPGGKGMGELKVGSQNPGGYEVIRKFFAAIRCQYVDLSRKWQKQTDNGFPHGLGYLVWHLSQQDQMGFLLCQLSQHPQTDPTDDFIQTLVAETASAFDDRRALLDGGSMINLAKALISAISLQTRLLTSQVLVRIPVTVLILEGILIDPLMTDDKRFLPGQLQADLHRLVCLGR